MAESQKGASSSVNSKEKDSLLDMEIGKDFLSSWKSMSVAEDDAMDFDFNTVTKGKKKTFNFDKLDMDFGLDGDFDKISSFKVDMSDLDISSPLNKTGKERSKGESATGNHQGKQDRMTFSFDFNELDSFGFGPNLMKEEKISKENQDSKGASNRSEFQGSAIHLNEEIGAIVDDVSSKLPVSGGVTTSKIETLPGGHGDLDPISEDCPSKSVAHYNCPPKSATVGNLVASQRARTSSEKTSTTRTQEKDQENHCSDETIPPEPYVLEKTQDISAQSASGHESTRDTGSELEGEVSSLVKKVSTSSDGEQNVNGKLVAGLGSKQEKLQLENPPPQHMARSLSNDGERNRFGIEDHAPTGSIVDAEPAQADSVFEDTSFTCVSKESLHDSVINREKQNSNSKLLLAPLSCGTMVNKLISVKAEDTGVIRSKFFKKSDETKSLPPQALSTQTKHTSFGSKRFGVQLNPTDERREGVDAKDGENGRNLTGIPWSHSRELNKGEPVHSESGNSIKGLKSIRESFNADGAQNRIKLIGSSRPLDGEVAKGKPVSGESEKNSKDLDTSSSEVNPPSSIEKTNKSITQNYINPRLQVSSMVSVKNLNKVCDEGNITSPLKVDRRTPGLSSLKISRTMGTSHDPSSTSQKEIKSLKNSDNNMELKGNITFKGAHSVGSGKQTPPIPSLKRKTPEEPNADFLTLNPSKRLSESPPESRNFSEPSERVVGKQISAVDISPKMNMTELEISSEIENDGNVEKAEACTKELDDICSMLKKKGEEAKEILVRAIVNNNNLLMLNHPIYEEKIRMVKKFAAQLMS
ncbi:uncharacterized protein At4g18490 isoform X2 [Cornus florida]|uniref:uncharacterized protein At4g18490 isoform X2 n=1 Tax=Cornus florida TaxID=4283 RepID=UPI0028989F63|nr:uncharacterized protein At4g18490 isoform X2 [Cornus florida]